VIFGDAQKRGAILFSFLSAVFLCDVAVSQDRLTRETVTTRYREDFDPVGARLGGFQLLPELGIQLVNDDNVFASQSGIVDDAITVFRPSLELRSDWSRNELSAGADAAINRFSEFSGEDHDTSNFFLNGRWDTANTGFLSGGAIHSTDYEGRESPEDANAFERTGYKFDQISLDYRLAPGRMFMEVGIDAADYDYDDVRDVNGVVINNDDRDGRLLESSLRFGYEFADGYSVFVQGVDRSLEYVNPIDDFGFERSSDGHEVMIGARLNSSDVIFGDVFVGSISQQYDDPRFVKITGTEVGADLAWNLSGLTTFRLQGGRGILPTTTVGAFGIDTTSYSLRAEHELLRNLIFTLEWIDQKQAFKGIDRKDDYHTIEVVVRYLMNRRFEVQLEYRNQTRDSNADENFEFTRRLLGIQLIGHL